MRSSSCWSASFLFRCKAAATCNCAFVSKFCAFVSTLVGAPVRGTFEERGLAVEYSVRYRWPLLPWADFSCGCIGGRGAKDFSFDSLKKTFCHLN